MIEILKRTVFFIIIILFQVLILDQIEIGKYSEYFSPLVYGAFILIYYPSFKLWILLILAFIMGLILDGFGDTLGMHASSLLTVAITKNYVLKIIAPRDGFNPDKDINVINIGINRFLIYGGITLFIHHFCFFVIEDFNFKLMHLLILKSIINSAVSLSIIVLFQYLILNKR